MRKYKLLLLLLLCSLHFVFTQNTRVVENSFETATTVHQKIKIFPNPAKNVVNILNLKNSPKATIKISDLSGNVLINHQWAIRKNALSIPIPNLNAGIYLIRIESENQQVQKKFLKQ